MGLGTTKDLSIYIVGEVTPEKFAEDLFHKMKGFKVTHKHSKKCAIVAVNVLIKDHAELSKYTGDYTIYDFYQKALTYLQNIKA